MEDAGRRKLTVPRLRGGRGLREKEADQGRPNGIVAVLITIACHWPYSHLWRPTERDGEDGTGGGSPYLINGMERGGGATVIITDICLADHLARRED